MTRPRQMARSKTRCMALLRAAVPAYNESRKLMICLAGNLPSLTWVSVLSVSVGRAGRSDPKPPQTPLFQTDSDIRLSINPYFVR